VVHSTALSALNSSDNLPSYPLDNHHSSDAVLMQSSESKEQGKDEKPSAMDYIAGPGLST